MFSPDVLTFLIQVVSKVTLSAADPDFDALAAVVSKTRLELTDAAQSAAIDPANLKVVKDDAAG